MPARTPSVKTVAGLLSLVAKKGRYAWIAKQETKAHPQGNKVRLSGVRMGQAILVTCKMARCTVLGPRFGLMAVSTLDPSRTTKGMEMATIQRRADTSMKVAS